MKYVALLAFNKIVRTYPSLVAQQEDVIMDCIDSADISIRLRALDLVVGMVSNDNLVSIVGRLMRQLRNSSSAPIEDTSFKPSPIEPTADSDDEDLEVALKSGEGMSEEILLPDDYKVGVIDRVLEMCSSNNYGNVVDFDWYVDILVQLVRNAPVSTTADGMIRDSSNVSTSEKIGIELRNVAVKVKAFRQQATRAAELILISTYEDTPMQLSAGNGVLKPIAWLVGEYASALASPDSALTALLNITKGSVAVEGLVVYLQAVPKILAFMIGNDQITWTSERKSMIALLFARVIHTLEPLAMHPDLEVQERAVEFSELLKLAAEAASGQATSVADTRHDAPLLLTQAIPSLFAGIELNSVAPSAQRNVPIPSMLDLDQPINENLSNLLRAADSLSLGEPEADEFESYYHKPQSSAPSIMEPAVNRLVSSTEDTVHSYQQGGEDTYLDPDIVSRRRAERLERNKDDPFYIAPNSTSGRSTPLHNILQSNNGTDLDIDAIPIMQLELGKTTSPKMPASPKKSVVSNARQRIQVAVDETLHSGSSTPRDDSENDTPHRSRPGKGKQLLLQVDSSHIGAFSLEEDGAGAVDYDRQQKEEAEMAQAMREVEKLRLEMQRANERIQAAQGVEGTVVKKKKKKSKHATGDDAVVVKKKKKVKSAAVIDEGSISKDIGEISKPKAKRQRERVVAAEQEP